ncbi:hypothetical protein M3Y98_01185700 [Aphelenchoides besseyi]|nr:hypothetical protein M3Y98_01185700 [Aphelenchoides besseyi]KAI6195247.1 hypothetical protein M3Y96_01210600 [Aphelenchoides besseyi]
MTTITAQPSTSTELKSDESQSRDEKQGPGIFFISVIWIGLTDGLIFTTTTHAFYKPFAYLLLVGPGLSLFFLFFSRWFVNIRPKTTSTVYLIFVIPIILLHLIVAVGLLLCRSEVVTPQFIDRNLVFDNNLIIGCVNLFAITWISIYALGQYRVFSGRCCPEDVGFHSFADNTKLCRRRSSSSVVQPLETKTTSV